MSRPSENALEQLSNQQVVVYDSYGAVDLEKSGQGARILMAQARKKALIEGRGRRWTIDDHRPEAPYLHAAVAAKEALLQHIDGACPALDSAVQVLRRCPNYPLLGAEVSSIDRALETGNWGGPDALVWRGLNEGLTHMRIRRDQLKKWAEVPPTPKEIRARGMLLAEEYLQKAPAKHTEAKFAPQPLTIAQAELHAECVDCQNALSADPKATYLQATLAHKQPAELATALDALKNEALTELGHQQIAQGQRGAKGHNAGPLRNDAQIAQEYDGAKQKAQAGDTTTAIELINIALTQRTDTVCRQYGYDSTQQFRNLQRADAYLDRALRGLVDPSTEPQVAKTHAEAIRQRLAGQYSHEEGVVRERRSWAEEINRLNRHIGVLEQHP